MINGNSYYNFINFIFFNRNDQELNLLRIGGNKNHLDLFIQYFHPNCGINVTLEHKYKSVISDFYRNLVIYYYNTSLILYIHLLIIPLVDFS